VPDIEFFREPPVHWHPQPELPARQNPMGAKIKSNNGFPCPNFLQCALNMIRVIIPGWRQISTNCKNAQIPSALQKPQ